MTAHPLDFAFPLMTPPPAEGERLSIRAPHAIAVDEIVLEIADEVVRRREIYPRLVARHLDLTDEQSRQHIACMAQILDDLTEVPAILGEAARARAEAERIERRRAAPFRWTDKVRELRREIAIRRRAYPKRIAGRRLDPGEARERMERLEAAHWHYWIELAHFDAPVDQAAPLSDRLQPVREQADRVDAFLLAAHHAADPAVNGYCTPEWLAWAARRHQQEQAA